MFRLPVKGAKAAGKGTPLNLTGSQMLDMTIGIGPVVMIRQISRQSRKACTAQALRYDIVTIESGTRKLIHVTSFDADRLGRMVSAEGLPALSKPLRCGEGGGTCGSRRRLADGFGSGNGKSYATLRRCGGALNH
jgi:hypothetical protein